MECVVSLCADTVGWRSEKKRVFILAAAKLSFESLTLPQLSPYLDLVHGDDD